MEDEEQLKTEMKQFDESFVELTRKELEVAMVNGSVRMELDILLKDKSQDYIQGLIDGLQFESDRQKRLSQILHNRDKH